MASAPQTLTITSRRECIDDARRWLAGHAQAAGFGEEAIRELELALTEALANVIEHAYAGDETREIALFVALDRDRLEVRVRDWGVSSDAAGYSRRNLDHPGEGGYGVYLMDQLMDAVTREPQSGGGTLLTLVKRKEGHHHG